MSSQSMRGVATITSPAVMSAMRITPSNIERLSGKMMWAISIAAATEVSADVLLEQPEGGGHAGFVSGPFPGNVGWLPRRLVQFLTTGR